MRVGGLDYETNGTVAEENYVTEIGAVVWDDTDWSVKAEFETFVFDEKALPLPDFITKLTRITDADVRSGRKPQEAFGLMQRFFRDCGALVSHNKQFEQDFTRASLARYNIDIDPGFGNAPWICTNEDIDHGTNLLPLQVKCKKLSHLVLDYGGTVDGSKLHRALADVHVMGQLLKLVGKPIKEHIEYAKQPWIYIHAKTNYDQRDLAKAAGYGWQTCPGTYGPIFEKKWVKRVKESQFDIERSKKCDFERVRIEPPNEAAPKT